MHLPHLAPARRKVLWPGFAVIAFCTSTSTFSWAQTTTVPPAGQVLLTSYGEVSSVDTGGGLGARIRLPRGFQLGVTGSGYSVRRLYLSGYESSGTAIQGRVFALSEFGVTAPLSLSLRLGTGWRHLSANEETPAGDSGDRLGTNMSIMGHFHAHPRASLRAGFTMLVDLQVAPEVSMASLGGMLDFGGVFAISNQVSVFSDFQAGGTYGFDGNNEKVLLTGRLGLSVSLGNGGRPWLVY